MRSINSIILLIIFVCVLMINGDVFTEKRNELLSSDIDNSDWYNAAVKNIKEREYNITYNDNTQTFQSPNREHNLRFHYFENGFIVEPRDVDGEWQIGIWLLSYGRDESRAYTGGELIIDNNTGIVMNDDISIAFINNNRGMRENFIVHKRERGTGLLELELQIDGDVDYNISKKGIIFNRLDNRIMEYKDLYVYDCNNKELESRFEKTDNGVKILVNDIDAVYPITIDPISTTINWMGESDQDGANYGISVSSAGDVNGDGYSDVMVGSNGYDNGESNEGAVFVYHGSSSGPSLTADWMGESNQANCLYGYSISSAGDVNGDGYSDVIVGAWLYDGGEGAAFLYYGSSGGLSETADWIGGNNQASSLYGYSVASAGDVNSDGYSDIIVGATYYDNGESNEGGAFVYYGNISGLSDTADWIGEGNTEDDYFGYSVASAGDVNGDGYSDIIVGVSGYDSVETEEGAAYVFYGGSSGLSNSANWIVESNQADCYFGYSVSSAGDVNGDGYSDVIIGSNRYYNGENNEGAVFVYYGGIGGLSTTVSWMGESNQANADYGRSVSSAGDVNSDGYSDIIVGAYSYDSGEADEGAAFVYYGSSSGLADTANWIGESNQASAEYGRSVSSAGDVNGDGYSDIIVGSNMYDNVENDEGAVFVYYGNEGGPSYKPIQMRNDELSMIVAPLISRSESGFKIGLTGRSYIGIDNVKLQWEVKALGIPFNGTGLSQSIGWYETGLDGIDIIEQVDGLSNNTYYKWRVRIKYDMTKGMVQPYSRWFYIDDNALTEVDVKTGVYLGVGKRKISIDDHNTKLMNFSIYKDIKLLNREIQEKGLTVYTIDGRKLNKILIVGQYYITKQINNKIIKRQKILIF